MMLHYFILSICIVKLSLLFALAVPEFARAQFQADYMPYERIVCALQSMYIPHEVRPNGVPDHYGWKNKPSVGMGTEPYASSLRSTWSGYRFEKWRSMLSWFVVYEADGGNPAKNAAVEIGGIEMWYLSQADRIWRKLQSGIYPKWHGAYSTNAVDKAKAKVISEKRSNNLVVIPTNQSMVHGGLGHVETPWSKDPSRADLAAVFVSVKHRLVVRNPSAHDDRDKARLVVQAGADYYPFMGARVVDLNATSVPSIGLGRFLLADEHWRYSTMIVVKKGLRVKEVLSGLPDRFDY